MATAREGKVAFMKMILRESDYPFFKDETLEYFLDKNGGSEEDALYECLILKSESTEVKLPGFEVADTKEYFLRLANAYCPSNSGILN